jgi:hypothetical protein
MAKHMDVDSRSPGNLLAVELTAIDYNVAPGLTQRQRQPGTHTSYRLTHHRSNLGGVSDKDYATAE